MPQQLNTLTMKRKQHVNLHLLPIVREEGISVSKERRKYLLDISKLIVGGAVITTALDVTSDKIVVINVAIGTAPFPYLYNYQ